MAVNRFTRFNPQQAVSQYIQLPFNEIMAVGQQKQATQDAAQAELAKINAGIKSIKSLPGDREYAQSAVNEISGNIDQFTTQDFNDPSVRANWNKTKSQITQRFLPTGDLGMIDMNYKLYSDWNKDFMKFGRDAGWGGDKLQGYSNQQANSFQTIDPETGEQKMFQGEDVANRVDYNDWLSKSLEDVAYDSKSLGLSQTYSGNSLYDAWVSGTIDSLDKAKITNALALRAQGDPQLVQSLEQEGKFNGQQGWGNFIKGTDEKGNILVDQSNPFGLMLTGVAQGAQFRREDPNYDIRTNPLVEHAGKKKMDEEPTNIPFKLPGTIPTNLQGETLDIPSPIEGLPTAYTKTSFFYGTDTGTGSLKQVTKPKPLNVNSTLTPKQEEIVVKAANAYGRTTPSSNNDKIKLYNEYVNDMNNREINIGYNQYTNPKTIENLNKLYFSPNQMGTNNAAYSEFTLISGEADKTKGSGAETVMEEFGNTDNYILTIAGSLNPDNPYYASGQVVQVTHKNGKLVATYAMETPLADDSANEDAKLKHSISQSKYTFDNESQVQTQKGTYNIEYIPIYHPQEVNDDGSPILTGESLKVTNPDGTETIIDPQYGDIWQQSSDYIINDSNQ